MRPVGVLLMSFLVSANVALAQSRPRTLPMAVLPIHYELTVSPDIKTMTFKGEVHITVNAAVRTREIVLNAQELAFARVTLDGVPSQSVSLDTKLNRATFAFANEVAIGQHELAITHSGSISSGTFGFFAMDDPNGIEWHILATHFDLQVRAGFLRAGMSPAERLRSR